MGDFQQPIAKQQIVCEQLRICDKNFQYHLRMASSKKKIPKKIAVRAINNVSWNPCIFDIYFGGLLSKADKSIKKKKNFSTPE